MAVHQNTFWKILESSQKYARGEAFVRKVAGFYRSNHRMHFVKKVLLERYLQNSQEKAAKEETLAQVFSWVFSKMSRNTFFTAYLRTTASAFSFSEAVDRGVLWKMCSWKFRKIYRWTPLVCEIFKSTSFTEHPWMTASGFFVQSY